MLRSDSDQMVVTQVMILNAVIVDIRIQKIDMDGKGLPGAVFQLKAVKGSAESDVEGVTGIGTVIKEIDGETRTFTSAFETTGAEQTFCGLLDGTYRLYEVYVPDGYISSFRYIEFQIDNRVMQNVTTSTGDDTKIDFTAASENTLALLKIKNEPGVELPHTGGPGTRLIYLAGVLITVLAAMGFVLNRKRNTI